MRYKEYSAPPYWPLWLLGLFALLLVPHCWLPELSANEARCALIAQEMAVRGNYLAPRLFGDPIFAFPMTSWLLALGSSMLPLNEFTIRLIGIVPVGLLALVCGAISFRLAGVHAGAVTATAVISTVVVVFQKGALGSGEMLFALLITCSWLVWYRVGRVHRHWFPAWFLSHLLVCLALLTGGVKAVLFFYFPLLWLRRPLRIWRRLAKAHHWLSLGLALLLITVWILLAPQVKEEFIGFFQKFQPREATRGYFSRFLEFPFRAIGGIVPWVFLLWPTFCEAFRPLENRPVFCGFLRTIVSSLFFFFWLVPIGNASILLPLLGPMAILVGMNYDLLVRRYGNELQLIVKGAAWLTLLLAGGWAVFSFANRDHLELFNLPTSIHVTAVVMVAAGVLLAGACLLWRLPLPLWLMMLLAMFMLKTVHGGTWQVYRYVRASDKRALAQRLAAPLPPDVPIYMILSTKASFPAECYYLKHPIKRTKPTGDLPNVQIVYVLSEREPIATNREWDPVTPVCHYREDYSFRIWKGVLTERLIHWRADTLSFPTASATVAAWRSPGPDGAILTQAVPDEQPLWLAKGIQGKPVIRFGGNQVLHRTDAELIKNIGGEYTIIMVVRLSQEAPRQTLLDIACHDDGNSILQRFVYTPASSTLTVSCRDRQGKVLALEAVVNLSKPTIITVRRDRRAIGINLDGAAAGSQPSNLGAMNAGSYVTAVGASWDGERYSDFLLGDIAELRIYNRSLSDERLQTLVQALKREYLEEKR